MQKVHGTTNAVEPVKVRKENQEDSAHVVDDHLEEIVALRLGKLIHEGMRVVGQLTHVVENDAIGDRHERVCLIQRTKRLCLSTQDGGEPFSIPKQVEARARAPEEVRQLEETDGKPFDTHLSFFGRPFKCFPVLPREARKKVVTQR